MPIPLTSLFVWPTSLSNLSSDIKVSLPKIPVVSISAANAGNDNTASVIIPPTNSDDSYNLTFLPFFNILTLSPELSAISFATSIASFSDLYPPSYSYSNHSPISKYSTENGIFASLIDLEVFICFILIYFLFVYIWLESFSLIPAIFFIELMNVSSGTLCPPLYERYLKLPTPLLSR